MSRDEGFRIADTDTGLLADPKILKLARRIQDPIRTAAAVLLYQAVQLASWDAGERVPLEDALPGWWLADHGELAEHLIAVGLLDREQRIPSHAWESWPGLARDRREERRLSGAKLGQARAAKLSSSSAEAQLEHSSGEALPGRSGRSHPADPLPSGQREPELSQPQPIRQQERDALDAWADLMGSWPTSKVIPWLDRLQTEHGLDATVRALAAEAIEDPDRRTMLSRTEARLGSWAHHASKEEERQRAEAEKRRAAEERARIEAMPPEQRRANMARLRDALGGSGISEGKETA